MSRRFLSPLIAAAFAALGSAASACSTCGVDPDSQVANAAGGTLWMLLGLVAFMFLATGFTALFIWRRTVAPIPPDVQFVENLTSEPEEC